MTLLSSQCRLLQQQEHRFTYPEGVHPFRYFLSTKSYCCVLMHIFIFISMNLNVHTCIRIQVNLTWMRTPENNWNAIYAWRGNNEILVYAFRQEIPEWVYAFCVCKPVKRSQDSFTLQWPERASLSTTRSLPPNRHNKGKKALQNGCEYISSNPIWWFGILWGSCRMQVLSPTQHVSLCLSS